MAGSLGKGSAATASSSTRWAVPSARCQASAHSSGAGRVVASAAARAWGSARTTRAALAVESRHPAGSTTTWGTRLLAASQAVTAFEVSGGPEAEHGLRDNPVEHAHRGQQIARRQHGTGVTAAEARLGVGQHRHPASPVARPATASASTGESAPTTATTRLPPTKASTSATAVRSGTTTPEATDGVGVVGGGAGSPAGQHQVVFEGEVEVDRSRRHADRLRPGVGGHGSGSVCHGRVRAPTPGGTSGRRRRTASPGRWSAAHPRGAAGRGGRRSAPAAAPSPGSPRPRPGGTRRRRSRTYPPGRPGDPPALAIPRAKKPALRSSIMLQSVTPAWVAKAAVSGVLRDPGEITASVIPRSAKAPNEGGGEAMGGDGGVHLAEATPSEVARRWGLGGPHRTAMSHQAKSHDTSAPQTRAPTAIRAR